MSSLSLVITGFGAVSAAGVGIELLMAAIRDNRSCFQPVPPEALQGSGEQWAPASAFRVADFMPPLKARKFDRCSQFAIVAAGMALKDAGIVPEEMDPTRIGIVMGCGFGGITNSVEFLKGYFSGGADGLIPMLFPNTVPNAAASNSSIEYRLKGPNVTMVQRFCSAESALLLAQRFLEEERADIMLVGGVDEIIPVILKGFRALGQLRPGGVGRGFGEGSGILVLERGDHALRRGARIRGRLVKVATIGLLPAGREEEGVARLLAGFPRPELLSLTGVAPECGRLAGLFPGVPRLDTGALLGRSLAMGGIAMTAHLLSLAPGGTGIHLAASPEGPWFAVGFQGADSFP
jgi:3-oxoacyl-[acyl-carrier-protein] synthase II